MTAVIFLDKDGVLVDNSCYPSIPRDSLYPGCAKTLQKLQDAGYLLFIVSNQSWVGKGLMSFNDADLVFQRIIAKLALQGVHIDGYRFCPHLPEQGCQCRKPGTAMLEDIFRETGANREESWIIGDMETDVEAGRRAGIRTAFVETRYGMEEKELCVSDVFASDFKEAVGGILSEIFRR